MYASSIRVFCGVLMLAGIYFDVQPAGATATHTRSPRAYGGLHQICDQVMFSDPHDFSKRQCKATSYNNATVRAYGTSQQICDQVIGCSKDPTSKDSAATSTRITIQRRLHDSQISLVR
jgi:hypothetical protein